MTWRQYMALGLIACLTAGFLIETWVLNQYVFNNKEFTASFCENTDKPELACNGACAVKKITQDDGNQQDSPASQDTQELEKNLLTWYVDADCLVEDVYAMHKSDYFTYHFPFMSPYLHQVDRPPSIA